MERWLSLRLDGVLHGAIWQVITYQFFHEKPFHLFANMLPLWSAGLPMEKQLGIQRFLILYLIGGVVGGIMQLSLQASEAEILLGASAAVYSTLIGFCTFYAPYRICTLLFFVVPLQLPARCLGWGIILTSLVFAMMGWLPGVGHLAHLGGCIFGFLAVRCWMTRSAGLNKKHPLN